MSGRSNDQSLKQAISQMLKTYHLDQKMNEVRLLNAWENVMGKTVSNRTTEMYIRNKKLFVFLNSASLREELLREREKIKTLLNKEAQAEVIEEVVFS